MHETIVHIVSSSGQALTPSKQCAVVRLLIKRGDAVPISTAPFTIRLKTKDPDVLECLYASPASMPFVTAEPPSQSASVVTADAHHVSTSQSNDSAADRCSPNREILEMTEVNEIIVEETSSPSSAEYHQRLASQRQEIAQKDAELKRKDAELQGKDGDLRLKDEMLRQKDEQLRQKDELMGARLAEKDAQIRERDARIRELEAKLQLQAAVSVSQPSPSVRHSAL